jgi:hypothetical protein
MAGADDKKVSRRAFIAAAGAAAAGVAAAAVIGSRERPEPVPTDRIFAKRVDGDIPVTDPENDVWNDAVPYLVPVAPQQVAPPFLDEAGVSELVVEALHDDRQLGLRLSWQDAVKDDLDSIAVFRDAVAVQIPQKAGSAAPITMGAPASPVHLLQWRATWQRDIEKNRQTVEILFPNVVYDETPEEVLDPETAALFYVGRVVGNPLSVLERETPIEEMVAAGFGSVTVIPEANAVGSGVHDGEGWKVAMGVPLERGSGGDPLEPGSVWPIAFAVWLGDRQNRGGRKHYANWVDLELEA